MIMATTTHNAAIFRPRDPEPRRAMRRDLTPVFREVAREHRGLSVIEHFIRRVARGL